MTDTAPQALPTFKTLLYDKPRPRVARVTLNRPERRNAQSYELLYELNDALNAASWDDEVHVIVIAAAGQDFSAGHDLSGSDPRTIGQFPPATPWGQFRAKGVEGHYCSEKEIYLDITERWRNLPKPTIVQVQGRVMAGGNMLIWPFDLVVASECARFMDNIPDMGIVGAEFFNHPYEMPLRKAKEWLFTTEWMDAAEAHRIGMVNRVVPLDRLETETLDLASRVAEKHLITLKLTKEALNNAQDLMGRRQAQQYAFALHHLGHSHFRLTEGFSMATDKLHPKVQESLRAIREKMAPAAE